MNKARTVSLQVVDKNWSPQRPFRKFVAALLTSWTGLFGFTIIIAVIVVALLAPVISPTAPNAQNLVQALKPPSLAGPLAGTDFLGRDILSRVIFGARISLTVGICSVLISGTIGTVLGIVAGYNGHRLDTIIMRLVDFQLSVPFIVLAIVILGILGPSLRNIILVLGITGWVAYARVVRSEVLSLREQDFVSAALATGATPGRVMFHHILPNVLAPTIVIASLEVARMIISEAALSFLGLGVPATTPSWGSIVADGRTYLQSAWWISTIPGLAIVMIVLGINLFGDWLRDYLDPRLRSR